MDPNKGPELDRWVGERMAALTRSEDWEPNVATALAALKHRRNSVRVRRTRVALVSVGAILLSGLLAFPTTRVLAQRCVGACIAETGTVREFFWKALHRVNRLPNRAIQPSERRIAPDFSLTDAGGKLLHLSDFRGQVVLLNFWATWCAPCKVEIPWFMEFQHTYYDAGFVVLGVAMDENGWTPVKPYLEQRRVNYRVMIGDDMIAESYGGLNALPTTLMIDRAGRIAVIHTGLIEKSTYETELATLMAEH